MALTQVSPTMLSDAPAFSAYNSGTINIATATAVKLACNTENFDTNNNYDSTTNYRFQPTVAGYYALSVISTITGTATAGSVHGASFWKNGASYGPPAYSLMNTLNYTVSTNYVVMYLNGSTDYVEAYAYHNGGSTITLVSGSCIFQGHRI